MPETTAHLDERAILLLTVEALPELSLHSKRDQMIHFVRHCGDQNWPLEAPGLLRVSKCWLEPRWSAEKG